VLGRVAGKLGLGAVLGLGRRSEKARQVGPGIAGSLDPLAADGKDPVLDVPAAEALVEEPARIVAQHPDDRRAAGLVDQPLEQREQEPAADPLVLPVGSDVERVYLAGEFPVAAATAAAEAENVAVIVDRHQDVARFSLDDGRPSDLAPPRRQATRKGVARMPA